MTPDSNSATCRSWEDRRLKVAQIADVTGIDYILTGEHNGKPRLEVVLLGKAPQDLALSAENVRVQGPSRSQCVRVIGVTVQHRPANRDDAVFIVLDKSGDDSLYTLEFLETSAHTATGRRARRAGRSHPAFDPFFARTEFRFAPPTATPTDCARSLPPRATKGESPEINYLAKDYQSFRSLIFDRLSTLMPEWSDRSPADAAITLTELLAHIGDHLSYHQDAVSTEAYLRTARQRISVRRHVRLIDYFMHDGCNARTFVCLQPEQDLPPVDTANVAFRTDQNAGLRPTVLFPQSRLRESPVVFEPTTVAHESLYFDEHDLKDSRELQLWWRMPLVQRLSHDEKLTPSATLFDLLDEPLQKRIRKQSKEQQSRELERLALAAVTEAIPRWFKANATPQQQQAPAGSPESFIFGTLLRMIVSAQIRQQLKPATLRLIKKFRGPGNPPPGLVAALVAELNRLLVSSSLRQHVVAQLLGSLNNAQNSAQSIQLVKRFAEVDRRWPQLFFSPEDLRKAGLAPLVIQGAEADLSETVLDDERLEIWNRLFLELVYPFAIAQHPVLTPGIRAFAAHKEMHIYRWGRNAFTLAAGATSAALIDQKSNNAGAERAVLYGDDQLQLVSAERELRDLQPGDILIFREAISPDTGLSVDADPRRRQAVRLTKVEFAVDRTFKQPIVLIEWDSEDALKQPLVVAAVGPPSMCCALIENATVVHGNVVLVDHGETIAKRQLLPKVEQQTATALCEGQDAPCESAVVSKRYRPTLEKFPLAFQQPVAAGTAAHNMLLQDPRQAQPTVKLTSLPAGTNGAPLIDRDQFEQPSMIAERLALKEYDVSTRMLSGRLPSCSKNSTPDPEQLQSELNDLEESWELVRDLLGSGPDDRHFTIEIDNRGRPHLRFGDGETGRRPQVGEQFAVEQYRVGDPRVGNVGAETITKFFRCPSSWPQEPKLTNWLPAVGGVPPEDVDLVRRMAPFTLSRRRERAVTPEDYAAIVEQEFSQRVQRAVAVRRRRGLAEEIFIAIDERGRRTPQPELLREIESSLYRYRRIGHDLIVAPPIDVPLRIKLEIVVDRQFQPDHVAQDVMEALTGRGFADGTRALFHPDSLTLGDQLRVSPLIRALCRSPGVPGVVAVNVKKFERFFGGAPKDLEEGFIQLGPLEVARLDNDPQFPERGVLTLKLEREASV